MHKMIFIAVQSSEVEMITRQLYNITKYQTTQIMLQLQRR